MLEENLKNRERIIQGLKEELIGPTVNYTNAIDVAEITSTGKNESKFYYYKYCEKNEEVHLGQPQRHYSAGLLYPVKLSMRSIDIDEMESSIEFETESTNIPSDESDTSEEMESEKDDTTETVSENNYLPSTMGITFAIKPDEPELLIRFDCGYYEKNIIEIPNRGSNNNWWFRKSLHVEQLIDLRNFSKNKLQEFILELKNESNEPISDLRLKLNAFVRDIKLKSTGEIIKIVTISATNITENTDKNNDSNIMFQSELSATIADSTFLPYPSGAEWEANISEEDKKFDLLYYGEKNYGFGQNCATTWKESEGEVHEILSTFLPEYEIKTMTPDIVVNGKKIEITHASLAAAENYEELEILLKPLIIGYKSWYEELSTSKIPSYYADVFKQNLGEIKRAIERIERGLNLLKENKVFECFRLVNLAMLMQMTMGKKSRLITVNKNGFKQFSEELTDPFKDYDYESMNNLAQSIKKTLKESSDRSKFLTRYKWRGFQIAFLLMTIESFVDKESVDRENVDLIWFPTGGGKTEAYLGAAAFSILFRRLTDPSDQGTDVIMRYTLRLLTADQFQRSARLICALDFLRNKFKDDLGEQEISLGMWVGSTTSPNTISSANTQLKSILRDEKTNLFPVKSCPWCGASMDYHKPSRQYFGYRQENGNLLTFCPDESCAFHSGLPIYFVDEQLYNQAPTFLIGTIDKFVQLTWNPNARSFFGINDLGQREFTPPNLIIQDELHLISGPLGTLSGIYESLIEDLCTDERFEEPILPKIICATATIKAYKEQIGALFARENASLFPPSGKDINDNYFSTIQKNDRNENVPGRKYVGFYPFTQGKLQTEVQVLASLLISGQEIPEELRDPYWTILSFYNSINDIGKGLTLMNQDVLNTMDNFYKVRNIGKPKRREIKSDHVMELSSRLNNGTQVVSALEAMKKTYNKDDNHALDVVLSSNIIEVGVDIDRLSLMTIVGQPKTTAQYIQVSGRVGRKVEERPGLIVTEYNPTNSNDKSHYEHFIEFHQRLYGQVEESSVTPFSQFAIKRGLPAVIIGFLRQKFDKSILGEAPDGDYIEQIKPEIQKFLNKLLNRMNRVDNSESKLFKKEANSLLFALINGESYSSWEYNVKGKKANAGFMAPMTKDIKDIPESVKPIIFSMRSVDAVAKLSVTNLNPEEELDFF